MPPSPRSTEPSWSPPRPAPATGTLRRASFSRAPPYLRRVASSSWGHADASKRGYGEGPEAGSGSRAAGAKYGSGSGEYGARWRAERGGRYDYEDGEEGEGEDGEEGDSDMDVDLDIPVQRPQGDGRERERERPPTRSHTDPADTPAATQSMETHARGDARSNSHSGPGPATPRSGPPDHAADAAAATTSAHTDKAKTKTKTKAAGGNGSTDAPAAAASGSGAHAHAHRPSALQCDASCDSAYGLRVALKGPRRQGFTQKIKWNLSGNTSHESDGEGKGKGKGKGKELEEGEVDEGEAGGETRPQDKVKGTDKDVAMQTRRGDDNDKAQAGRDPHTHTIRGGPRKVSGAVRVDAGVAEEETQGEGVRKGERAGGSERTEREANKGHTNDSEVDGKTEDKPEQERDASEKRSVKHTTRGMEPRNEDTHTRGAKPTPETAVHAASPATLAQSLARLAQRQHVPSTATAPSPSTSTSTSTSPISHASQPSHTALTAPAPQSQSQNQAREHPPSPSTSHATAPSSTSPRVPRHLPMPMRSPSGSRSPSPAHALNANVSHIRTAHTSPPSADVGGRGDVAMDVDAPAVADVDGGGPSPRATAVTGDVVEMPDRATHEVTPHGKTASTSAQPLSVRARERERDRDEEKERREGEKGAVSNVREGERVQEREHEAGKSHERETEQPGRAREREGRRGRDSATMDVGSATSRSASASPVGSQMSLVFEYAQPPRQGSSQPRRRTHQEQNPSPGWHHYSHPEEQTQQQRQKPQPQPPRSSHPSLPQSTSYGTAHHMQPSTPNSSSLAHGPGTPDPNPGALFGVLKSVRAGAPLSSVTTALPPLLLSTAMSASSPPQLYATADAPRDAGQPRPSHAGGEPGSLSGSTSGSASRSGSRSVSRVGVGPGSGVVGSGSTSVSGVVSGAGSTAAGTGTGSAPGGWDRYEEGRFTRGQHYPQLQTQPVVVQGAGYARGPGPAQGAHRPVSQVHLQPHSCPRPSALSQPQTQPYSPYAAQRRTAHHVPHGIAPPSQNTWGPAQTGASPITHAHAHQRDPRSPWLYAGEEAEYEDEEGEGGSADMGGDGGGEVDGIGDECMDGVGEDGERPKKRRRTRVALSCAECKRRKIKCDRAQPCTPCARRGDQSNCKWTVLDTKDGSPTRAEFDALQARLAQVERVLYSLTPGTSMYHTERVPPPLPDAYVMRSSGVRHEPTHSLAPQLSPDTSSTAGKFRTYPPPRDMPGPDGSGNRGVVEQWPREYEHYRAGSSVHSPGPRPASPSGTRTAGGGFASVYTTHHAAGPGYATNGPVFPPPAPMVPRSPPMAGVGTRSSPIKVEDMDDPTPDGEHDEGQGKARGKAQEPGAAPTPRASVSALPLHREPSAPASTSVASKSATVSGARPTLRLLPEALRPNPTPGRLSGTTFPLSDADWEQMTSVALTGTNKQRPEGGSMHVDVQRELEALVGTLPCKKSCDRIWTCYVDRLEWQHCVLHPEAFRQMYDTFWAFKTNAERASCTPIAWLALLLIVTSHGLATMKPADAKTFGIAEDTAHWRMLCTQLWIASERALALDNFTHAVTLEVVQTLILLSYRTISLDPKGWFHQAPVLAMAIRLAMSIGINNVANDRMGELGSPGLCKRELWRRIWFNIVYLDWRFSVPIGETYFINHSHYHTACPANMDWSDMVDGNPFTPKPRKIFTSSSMFLAKIHNAERVRELCDALNLATRNGHQDVTRLFYDHEVAVNAAISLEPPCLISKDTVKERTDKRVQWARIGHALELHYRAIQIHRSFLVADFREARVRGVCVDTAEKMLGCYAEGKHVDAPSAWWWYGYTACVVLMMEQYYSDLQPQTNVALRLNEKLENIMSYVAMQRNCEEVTVRAWDGILILETLVAELQRRRIAASAGTTPHNAEARHPSLKRTYDQIDSPSQMVTRVSSSSPIHAFRKWILNVMPFLKLPPVPGLPLAHPRQRDMDAAFWDAILDIDTELHKSSRRGNFGKS